MSENDIDYMNMAFEEAETAFNEREVPIGCIFVKNGSVIARGHNRTNATGNGTLHAEMVAISETLEKNHNDDSVFQGSTLYVTIEPCIMCASAISQIGVKRAVFGASNDRFGGCGSVLSLHESDSNYCYEVVRGVQKERSIQLLQRFYDRENDKAPDSKRRKKCCVCIKQVNSLHRELHKNICYLYPQYLLNIQYLQEDTSVQKEQLLEKVSFVIKLIAFLFGMYHLQEPQQTNRIMVLSVHLERS